MQNSPEYWRLSLVDKHGTEHRVNGSDHEMRALFEEIKERLASGDDIGPPFIHLSGRTDSYDRADLEILVRVDEIAAATLMRMY